MKIKWEQQQNKEGYHELLLQRTFEDYLRILNFFFNVP